MKLYKVLGSTGLSTHVDSLWHMPKRGSGKWMPAIKGDLAVCENGYHLCRRDDLIHWLGPRIFEAEYDGELIKSNNKVVVRRARLIREMNWTDKTARLFACDCAERVLHLYEDKYPDDSRVRNCIEIARKVANGDLSVSELAAARDAARDAAWAAAGAAARAAAGAAARDAAWAAAGAAARDAAGDAAWAAAWAAERKWQTRRLFKYLEAS